MVASLGAQQLKDSYKKAFEDDQNQGNKIIAEGIYKAFNELAKTAMINSIDSGSAGGGVYTGAGVLTISKIPDFTNDLKSIFDSISDQVETPSSVTIAQIIGVITSKLTQGQIASGTTTGVTVRGPFSSPYSGPINGMLIPAAGMSYLSARWILLDETMKLKTGPKADVSYNDNTKKLTCNNIGSLSSGYADELGSLICTALQMCQVQTSGGGAIGMAPCLT